MHLSRHNTDVRVFWILVTWPVISEWLDAKCFPIIEAVWLGDGVPTDDHGDFVTGLGDQRNGEGTVKVSRLFTIYLKC